MNKYSNPDVVSDIITYIKTVPDDSVDNAIAWHVIEHLDWEQIGSTAFSDTLRVARARSRPRRVAEISRTLENRHTLGRDQVATPR